LFITIQIQAPEEKMTLEKILLIIKNSWVVIIELFSGIPMEKSHRIVPKNIIPAFLYLFGKTASSVPLK